MLHDESYGGGDGERDVTVVTVVVRLVVVVVPVFMLLPNSLLPSLLLLPAVLAQHRTSQRRRALAGGRCVRAGGELHSRNSPGTRVLSDPGSIASSPPGVWLPHL